MGNMEHFISKINSLVVLKKAVIIDTLHASCTVKLTTADINLIVKACTWFRARYIPPSL